MNVTVSTTPSAARRPRRSSAETREHVLDVAHELFYWEGIHATGIDRVAQAAEVGPTTLYRLFANKDELIAAYVERNSQGYRQALAEATDVAAGTPRERLMALFDTIAEQVQPENCRGCPFLMALAEFPDPAHPAHVIAVSTKAWVRERLHDLADALADAEGVDDPALLADQLALVVEGVYASVQALSVTGPAAHARETAQALIDAATAR
jgi:AcrR family transcriptional regulator